VIIVLLSLILVSGNNQIGFDLPVDNLKTGKVRKVRNIFQTTYGGTKIFFKSVYHTSQGGRVGNMFLLGGRVVLIPIS
jgi:hypothetical protein